MPKLPTESRPAPPADKAQPRKPYAAPRLTRFGEVTKLTRGGAVSTVSDSGNNSMRPP